MGKTSRCRCTPGWSRACRAGTTRWSSCRRRPDELRITVSLRWPARSPYSPAAALSVPTSSQFCEPFGAVAGPVASEVQMNARDRAVEPAFHRVTTHADDEDDHRRGDGHQVDQAPGGRLPALGLPGTAGVELGRQDGTRRDVDHLVGSFRREGKTTGYQAGDGGSQARNSHERYRDDLCKTAHNALARQVLFG